MAEKQEGYHALTALATGGTFAALLYNILAKKPGAVAGEDGVVHLDEEVMQILAGIAVTEQAILDEIKNLVISGSQGFPPNCRGFVTFQVPVLAALAPLNLPNFEIPEGFQLVVKSHPLNAVGTIMYIAESQPDALNVNTAWPLLINESLGLAVKNSSALWVAASGASMLACVVEQR